MIARRQILAMLGALPALSAGGCCMRGYPRPETDALPKSLRGVAAYLKPKLATNAAPATDRFVDVHAHFFNASDVPVRGFLDESIGHNAPSVLQPLIKLLALLAEKIATIAPTAREELDSLLAFEGKLAARTAADVESSWATYAQSERRNAEMRVVEVTANSDFIRAYLRLVAAAGMSLRRGQADRITVEDVRTVVTEGERRKTAAEMSTRSFSGAARDAEIADGLLAFLYYMLSYRCINIDTYKKAFTEQAGGVRISAVFGAMVDFDYWLQCPPASAHDDQITLQRLLSERSDRYVRPLVAYNPWTDIELEGEGLRRVKDAMASGYFAGVKIYPPMGFFPIDNEHVKVDTDKRRPDLVELDGVLAKFFDYCRTNAVVVMSHTSHSNGRDAAHDNFGGPQGWGRFLDKYAAQSPPVKLNLGHFGGASFADWTQRFADLMQQHPDQSVYADLGFWDALECTNDCRLPKARLRQALSTPIAPGVTVADRTMFGTDWHMLSRTSNWPAYPQQLFESVKEISDAATAVKIFGANAAALFDLHSQHPWGGK